MSRIKYHIVVGMQDNWELQITCHNVESKMKNYQLRCGLAIVISRGGTATEGS